MRNDVELLTAINTLLQSIFLPKISLVINVIGITTHYVSQKSDQAFDFIGINDAANAEHYQRLALK